MLTKSQKGSIMLIMRSFLFFGLILFFCLIMLSCDFLNPADIRIRYEVSGSATSATVEYRNSSGDISKYNVTLPWSTIFYVSNGHTAQLNATVIGNNNGITVRLSVNGELIEEDSGQRFASVYKWIWIDR